MARLINLELFTDFFNKIDPSRKSRFNQRYDHRFPVQRRRSYPWPELVSAARPSSGVSIFCNPAMR